MPIILPKCPDNYDLVKDNCRCKKKTLKKKTKQVKKKKKQVKKKTKIKKTKKKLKKKTFIEEHKGPLYFKSAFEKKIKQKWKDGLKSDWSNRYGPVKGRCKKGYMKNSEDKFCYTWKDAVLKKNTQSTKKIKRKVPKKKAQKKKTQKKAPKAPTPAISKRKSKIISRLRSYSPTINKEISRLSVSPHKDMFGGCKENQIKINNKCSGWKTKKSQTFLLDNLKSKKPIIASNIIGPNQKWSNCWFNSMFVAFYISDKGRKFMKSFRESMITGIIRGTNEHIPNNLQYPFWLLNKFITASLIGKEDPSMFASLMDTNNIIKRIYNKLKKHSGKEILDWRKVTKVREAGNPINMFLLIRHYFDNIGLGTFGIQTFYINSDYEFFNNMTKKGSKEYMTINTNNYHMLIISMSDEYDNGLLPNGKKAKVSDFKKQKTYTFGNKEYKLDSIVLRDVNKNHMCALLKINGQDYMFDGENATPLYKRRWEWLLNHDKNFKITSNISEKYNLTKGYQCLIYYRTK